MPLQGKRSPLPPSTVVHRVVEGHARRAPERIAVTAGAQQLNYRDLNARANQFAHHLMSLGVGRGSVVGVCLDRRIELLVSILGILKAGAAYLPLDPSYPRERLSLMLAQLPQIKLNVTSQATNELIGSRYNDLLDVDEVNQQLDGMPTSDPDVELTGDDLCYVVFTSGSTGIPKATAVRHDGWFNLLEWLRLEYRLDHRSSGLSVSSFGFDISQRGLMAPLFTGAPIHLLTSRSFDPTMAYRAIAEHGVKTLHCAPSTLYMLIEYETRRGTDALTEMDYVFIGGEKLSLGRVRDWAQREGNRCTLLHQYGVAECTDVASSHVLADYSRYQGAALPAGPPVYNTEMWFLDEELREVRQGETGEICISGRSVSAGYLNAAPNDLERFTEVELGGIRTRIYRTGDMGYATADGEVVVVGRRDAQVKIRGMRMDLGDVEHAVRSMDSVHDVAVLALPDSDGELSLVAFVLPALPNFDPQQLRADLLTVLPRNMVPQEYLALDAFPLNPNGKLDRLALSKLRRS